jgi:flagellar protein FlaG
MYEREPLPRVSDVKSVSRPVRQQTVPGGTQAVAIPAEGEPVSAAEQLAQAPQTAIQQRAKDEVTNKALEQTVSQMNTYAQNLQRALQFRVDKDSGETVVRIVDSKTDEVIRQIPNEEALLIANRMRAAASARDSSTLGMLIQESV